jgi:hypothetical protein
MVESANVTTKLTVSPDDSAAALRIGWTLAEVRGRFDPRADQSDTPNPPPPALLLDAANERSAVERQVEAVKILATLSEGGGGTTDLAVGVLSFGTEWATGNNAEAIKALKASGMLRYLAACLIWSRTKKDLSGTLGSNPPLDEANTDTPEMWWNLLAMFLWAWDEAIQDQFATQTFGTASSYELGRGLAESYWALNPSAPAGDPSSWSFLLGEDRVDALAENSRRLAPVIGTITAGAVESTVRSWGTVAKDPGDYVDPQKKLKEQIICWRDLLVTGRDPLTMVDSHELEKVARRPWPLFRAFGWEIVLVLIGGLLIGLAAAYLSKASATILSVLGAVGITASALVGWAKSNVQKVTDRVRDAVNLDAVIQGVQRLPEPVHAQAPRATGLLRLPPRPSITDL